MSIGTAIRTQGPEEGSEKMLVWQALLQKAREERRGGGMAVPVVVAARPRWTGERRRGGD